MAELKDYTKLLQDPDFLASISQIVAGMSGSGSVGQGIGEGTRYRQKLDLEKTELQDRRSFRDRQQSAIEQRDYVSLVNQKHEDYDNRKRAALVDVQKTIDAMDPSDYAKLGEVLPRTLEPYQLEQNDKKQIASNALGRIQSKDWTTFDQATGKRNVEPGSSETVTYMTRKEAIKAEQDFKKEQEVQRKAQAAEAKVNRATLESELRNAARTPGAAERLVSGLDESQIMSKVEAQGIVGAEQNKIKKEEGELRLQQVRENAMVAATNKANQPSKTEDKTKLTEQESEELSNAVMLHPELIDRMPPTQFAKIAPKLVAKGFTAFGKPMGERSLVKIAESRSALRQLEELEATMIPNLDKLGPVTGLEALNPWSDKRKIQADLQRVAQNVGKAMEGGVLRKEDTVKYQKMLSQITDVPSTALYKLRQVKQMIANDIQLFIETQGAGGRNIEGFEKPSAPKDTNTKVKVVDFDINGEMVKP